MTSDQFVSMWNQDDTSCPVVECTEPLNCGVTSVIMTPAATKDLTWMGCQTLFESTLPRRKYMTHGPGARSKFTLRVVF